MSSADQRKHPRVELEVDFYFVLDGEKYTGKTGNISLSGAFLFNPEPEIPPSATSKEGDLQIEINGEMLPFKCTVVYVIARDNEIFPVGLGAFFAEDDEQTQQSIAKLTVVL
jgi:hypothetical protein